MTDLILRTSVLLVSAWLASRLLTRATAATRHLLWHAVVVAVLAAPVLGRLAPEIRLPVADQWLDHTVVSSIAAPLRGQRLPAPLPATNVTRDSPSSVRDVPPAATRANGGELAAAGTITWLAGSLLMFLWFGSGIIAAAALVRRCRPAAAEWQAEAARLGSEMGLRTSAAVRVMPQDSSPLTIGWFKSTILLPQHATEWDADRRRSVLLHELAHVRRRDCLVQALAQLACSLYWFNPLMWVAASALRRERERACDDEVLVRGAQASSYASHLLAIARDLQPRLASHAAVAMARPRELEGRLLAVLSSGRARVPARRSRWLVAMTIVIATAVALGARATPTTSPAPAALSAPAAVTPVASDERMLAILASALNDADRQVREKAALSLAFYRSAEVIPMLLQALGDPDAQVREKAALGLAFRNDPRVIDPLIGAARDEDSQVREKAIIALGTTGDARVLPALEAAMTDPDPQVREKAVAALMLLRMSKDKGL